MVKSLIVEEDKLQAQERILSKAEELFGNNGFAGTRISDIAREAGVNSALVHYYYNSKENLYQQIIMKFFEKWEIHIKSMAWNEEDPVKVLSNYIRKYFEFQCRYTNFYKMFQWEALEGKNIFQQYVYTFWLQDMLDKVDIIRIWNKSGLVNEQVDGKMLLYMIWGMANQFYYRNQEELSSYLDSSAELEVLREKICNQMISLILNGFIKQQPQNVLTAPAAAVNASELLELHVVNPVAYMTDGRTEAAELLRKLEMVQGLELQYYQIQEFQQAAHAKAFLLIIDTELGEIPDWVLKFLQYLKEIKKSKNDWVIGIWVNRDTPASQELQRLLEDNVNRAGANAVSRPAGDNPADYARRLTRMMKAYARQY